MEGDVKKTWHRSVSELGITRYYSLTLAHAHFILSIIDEIMSKWNGYLARSIDSGGGI